MGTMLDSVVVTISLSRCRNASVDDRWKEIQAVGFFRMYTCFESAGFINVLKLLNAKDCVEHR
jgi:hypothetical protein